MSRFVMYFVILLLMAKTSIITAQQNIRMKETASQSHLKTMAAIASYTASGNTDSLKKSIAAGLDAGLSISGIKEVLVQLYAYCGFPRSINGINALMTVLEERSARGIQDEKGKEATSVTDDNKYETGRKNLQKLTGVEETGPKTGVNGFAPVIDTFLKEHLFADIFSRDVLSFRQREMVTIAALATMTGTAPQLKAHLAMGKNTGITSEDLAELTGIIEQSAGRSQANILRKLTGQTELPIIQPDMLVRISEIEIIPEYLEQYKKILKEESSTSVQVEPGVIAIFPMWQKQNPATFRLVEMYASQAAYQAHLRTAHFTYYKTATLTMVKSLKLVDMEALDPEGITSIFSKTEKFH